MKGFLLVNHSFRDKSKNILFPKISQSRLFQLISGFNSNLNFKLFKIHAYACLNTLRSKVKVVAKRISAKFGFYFRNRLWLPIFNLHGNIMCMCKWICLRNASIISTRNVMRFYWALDITIIIVTEAVYFIFYLNLGEPLQTARN